MMSLGAIAFVGSLLLPAMVFAVPNVTVVPLGGRGCYSWPNWDTGAPSYFIVDQSEDDAINGLYAVQMNETYGDGTFVSSLVIDLRKSTRFAKDYYRCWHGYSRAWSLSILNLVSTAHILGEISSLLT